MNFPITTKLSTWHTIACRMGWHTWRYVARGHNKEAYRLCQCCQKIEREDFILTDYTSATTAEKRGSDNHNCQRENLNHQAQIPYHRLENQRPESRSLWRKRAQVIGRLATIDILRSDFVIVDPDRLAYPTLQKPSGFDPFQL